MIRTIIWFVAFGISLLIALMAEFRYWYLGKWGRSKKQMGVLHNTTTRWARLMVRFTGSAVDVVGVEKIPEGHVLFVSNHQSNFDIPLLMGYVPKFKGFVAKIELERVPVISWWMKKMDCLFLDRQDMRQSLKVILQGIDLLKAGHTMVIFPEGTRSRSHEMGEFKKGSLKLAVKSGVPIVPVTIDGSYTLFEERNRIRKSHVKVTIHDPVYTKDMTREQEDGLVDQVYQVIEKGLMDE